MNIRTDVADDIVASAVGGGEGAADLDRAPEVDVIRPLYPASISYFEKYKQRDRVGFLLYRHVLRSCKDRGSKSGRDFSVYLIN